MKTFAHMRPIRNEAGERIGESPAPVSRVTVAPLGGEFGRDKRRRLVVTLCPGDVIQFRPERTRQAVTMLAADLYRVALRAKAGRAHLEKARAKKQQKADARERRRIANTDRRLRQQAQEHTP